MQKPCIYAASMFSAKIQGFYFKAADGNRTRDLRTTNATLYRLSHSSLWFAPTKCIIAWGKIVCQPLFIGNYSSLNKKVNSTLG